MNSINTSQDGTLGVDVGVNGEKALAFNFVIWAFKMLKYGEWDRI